MGRYRRGQLFTRRRSVAYVVFVAVCIVVLLASLVLMDNLRIAVRRYDISIPSLAASAQGTVLLHLSDLKGMYFGPGHSRLFSAIGTSRYDLVVITGDLLDDAQDAKEQQAVLSLVDQFSLQGKPVYYIPGDRDPALTVQEDGARVQHPFYTALAAHGAQRVDAPTPVPLGDATLWLWPMDLFYIDAAQAAANVDALGGADPQTLSYAEQLLLQQSQGILFYEENRQERDVVAVLSHYPLTEKRLEDFAQRVPGSDALLGTIDLALSGHYLHGQIRLPLLGAVYVPASDQGFHGLFPDEDKIYGRVDLNGLTMHISGGLGVPSRFPVRILATPEITFLRLTRAVSLSE